MGYRKEKPKLRLKYTYQNTQCRKDNPKGITIVKGRHALRREAKREKRGQTKHHGGIIRMIRTTGQVTDRMLLKGWNHG